MGARFLIYAYNYIYVINYFCAEIHKHRRPVPMKLYVHLPGPRHIELHIKGNGIDLDDAPLFLLGIGDGAVGITAPQSRPKGQHITTPIHHVPIAPHDALGRGFCV